jgi:hypothetical protein
MASVVAISSVRLRPVRELARVHLRELLEAHAPEQLHRALVQHVQRALALPEVVARAQAPLQRHAHVLQHGHVREHRGDLEGADHAAARDVRRLLARDVVLVEEDRARGRRQEFREQVEEGRLPRAVGADERVDGAPAHLHAHLVDGDEALEFLREAAGFEDGVAGRHGADDATAALPQGARRRTQNVPNKSAFTCAVSGAPDSLPAGWP